MNDELDCYSFGEELPDKLRAIGIAYQEADCPVCWHPDGWDFNNTETIVHEVPDGISAKDYHLLNLDKFNKEAMEKWKELNDDWSLRIMHVRSQLFVSEEGDHNPKYIVYQPWKTQ